MGHVHNELTFGDTVSAILEGKPDKNLILVTGRAHPKLATDVAQQLGIDVLETTAYDFANGEMYVRYTESVRGADVFVLQSHSAPVNDAIMEQLIMIDALKRASARSITAVSPLLGYSRQDKKHRGREPISCRLVFDLLKTAGADRIMSVDLHAAQSQGFFDGPVDHLIAMPVLVDYIRDRFANNLDNVTVVSPDAGRIRVAEQWAQRLGGGPLAFVHKTRDITRPNQAVANRVVGDVKGKDCVLVDDLIMIDALKRASARSITAVSPLLGYSRQDKKHRGREPISCRLVFDLLKTAGADRIMSVDLHAAQSQGFFDGPVDHLIAMPVLVDYIRDRFANNLDNVTVVSPDAGRIRVAEQWAQRLGGGPLAFVHKTRDITRPNQAVANRVVGDVKGKDCVLVDDLIDTAGTIAGACKVLQESSAKSVTVVATHGVLSGPAVERLKNCGAREVVLTDTVPIPEEKRWDGLTVLSIAPLLASAIKAVFEDGSVAELFDTYPEHHGKGFLFA